MITSLGFKAKARPQKYKKARYAIGIVSEKDISKIIKDFEKIEKIPCEKKRPEHEPTESYFHLERQLANCMMISDNLNWYHHCGYTKMTAPYSNVNVMKEGESKHSIINKNLSQSFSTNKNKSKLSIVNKPLSQNYSAGKNELRSTKQDESESANTKQKDANIEVACDVTNYFNVSKVFECGRNNPDVSCERSCIATENNEYLSNILDTLKRYYECSNI